MTDINIGIWIGFSAFVFFALFADTFLLSRKLARPNASLRAAIIWSIVWVSSALIFNCLLWLFLYQEQGILVANKKALDFFTGYIIEKSLSIDNLFVFYLLFTQLKIPLKYQHRVFSYGIWSAIIMRFIFIVFLSWLLNRFHWIFYLMGAFLFLTGLRIFWTKEEKKDLADSKVLLLLKKHLPITHELEGEKFIIRRNGLLYFTPLFIALIFIEISDLIFALDSIPAIFAITTDPFIVWSSNIFAILGLRAMYFVLMGMLPRFELLKYGLALIIIFVGAKMLLEPWLTISVGISLIIISGILLSFIFLSLLKPSR